MKGLEALQKICAQYYNGEQYKVIEKELKVLEIIRNKEINIHALLLHLKRFDYPAGYNALVGDKYKLTQEEYDLLKEVLL